MKNLAATKKVATSSLKKDEQMSENFVHFSAIIDPSVTLGENVTIHANVVIERGVSIGNDTVIHAGTYVGEDCTIGNQTTIFHSVTLREKTQIGNRVIIESGVVVGSDGFGYAKESNGINFKVPQVGYVMIDDDVKIGANTTIDRATLGKTIINHGAIIGNLVQIGHNVNIGADSSISDCVGVCGSCKIGAQVNIGFGVGMVGHIRIGDGARINDGSGITKDVQEKACIVGFPALNEDMYERFQQLIGQLPDFANRLNAIEKKLNNGSGKKS